MAMYPPKRITGFMPLAKAILTEMSPRELTAQEVVHEVGKRSGKLPSAAANPEASLVATLTKHHSQHGIQRKRDGFGRYRYFVESQVSPQGVGTAIPANACYGGCCITLSPDDAKRVRALVDLGQYPNEHEAHRDLVKKGLGEILSRLSN